MEDMFKKGQEQLNINIFEKFGFAPKEITDETELAEIRTNLVGEDMDENIDKPIWEIQMTREEFLANPRWNK